MNAIRLGFILASFGFGGLLGSQVLAQTILYSDTFTRTTGSGDTNGKPFDPDNFSDWGDNDNSLGGTLISTWTVGPTRGGGANQVTDGELASTIEGSARFPVDVTTMAPNGFVVELDFNRFHPFNEPDPFGTNNGFVSIGFGTNSDSVQGGGQFNINNADLSILFQQPVGSNQGNTQIHEDSVLIDPLVDGDPGTIDYGDPLVGHSVEITLVPQVAGQFGDSDTINLSVAVDGGTAHNFSVLGGSEFGVLSLASNGFVHRSWDNLVVTALPVTGVPGDADGDNDVDGQDFLIYQRTDPSQIPTWEANYGTGVSAQAAIAAVPEPAAVALLLLALTCGATFRSPRS